jgi:hypothetical protein
MYLFNYSCIYSYLFIYLSILKFHSQGKQHVIVIFSKKIRNIYVVGFYSYEREIIWLLQATEAGCINRIWLTAFKQYSSIS